MRVLVLTAEARVPDLSAVYQSLPRYLDIDLHVLGKAQQRQLRRYLAGLDLQSYQRILLDLPFKHMVAQATLLARLPGLLIYEEDACQNYLATSKWRGAFSRFYRQLPAARLVVTGASVAERLRSEGFDALFMAKGYNPHLLFNEQQVRDIELGFIGRTASRDYAGRKALLDSLAALEPLQLLRTEPGAEYRHMLNRIRYFVSADVGLGEYMAKNFEAMACGCVLLAWRQGSEEEAIGLQHDEHLLLYSSLDELREHLARLRREPQLAERLARAGQAFVASQLSHEQLAERLAAVLQEPWPSLPVASRWQRFCSLFKPRRG
jgi:glycosyltransferase involved in cell wall biosynthesis